jgi:transposase
MFSAAYAVRRAVQCDARDRTRVYWAAHRERELDPAAVRARVGLSRNALEHAAYAHIDAAAHLRRFVNKALAMHLANSVWRATERHLFADATGHRHGMPGVTRFHDFRRLTGRGRSHTKERKWETFRLHGTLDGHRAAYTDASGAFFQPRKMRPLCEPSDSWWSHAGPFAVALPGLPGGTLVLPVRLPAAPANQAILDHHLADPARWHKIDVVRRQDPNAAGTWRYEAHLFVLVAPYVSSRVAAGRAATALHTVSRSAGIDVNVSNVTVASHALGHDLRVTRVERTGRDKARGVRRARYERRRLRALDRSRRAMNAAQYQLSKRQQKRARRREEAGLPAVQVVPAGPRAARADGKPLRAYKKDALSKSYRRGRAAVTAGAASVAQARRGYARMVAHELVGEHGYQLVVEDSRLRDWARVWGRSLAAFSPGLLLTAIDREATAVAALAGVVGGVARASTRTTALSQRCLCGARVTKTLAERIHDCAACGLLADRDAMSAALGACVVLAERDLPGSATLDLDRARTLHYDVRTRLVLRDTLPVSIKGRQDVPSESTAHSARDGSFVAEKGRTPDTSWWSGWVARRIAGTAPRATLDETGSSSQTTPERARMRTRMLWNGLSYLMPFRDSS